MPELTPAQICDRLRGCQGAEVDAAVAECLRGPAIKPWAKADGVILPLPDADLLDTRARLVTLLREGELWPPVERYRVAR